ncbi:hypothetical protein RB298_05035 [Priestia sp. BR_2]
MKIYEPCAQCMEQNNLGFTFNVKSYDSELTDSRIYEFTCDYGHNNVLYLENDKFDILFHLGLLALHDGYYREAATSFAVAIERFHEFSIAVFAQEHKKRDGKDESFDAKYQLAWKEISKQSERQLGAYVMLYFITFTKEPVLMSNKHIQFRNDVIHRGMFPSLKQTKDYAEATFEYIMTKLRELFFHLGESMDYISTKDYRDHLERHMRQNEPNKIFIPIAGETALYGDIMKTFDEAYSKAKDLRFFRND